MSHGSKSTFEIVNEKQFINGVDQSSSTLGFRFGRIFHGIPPFRPTDLSIDELGKAMTANANRSDSTLPAGYTYFGQFIDHDITHDTTAGLTVDAPLIGDSVSPDTLKQLRSPSLDLDSVYGLPDGANSDFLQPDGIRFRLGTTSATPREPRQFVGFDVPRQGENDKIPGKALIGDHRNDENLIVQQLHTVFLKFHNKVVDVLERESPGESAPLVFARARDLVTKHYQWIVLHDFVKRICDPKVWTEVFGPPLTAEDGWNPTPVIFKVSASQIPPMPLEFSGAAFRFGHSLVREDYTWNRIFASSQRFILFFRFSQLSGNLAGSENRFPSDWIADWRRMFKMEDVEGEARINRTQISLNLAKSFDVSLAQALGALPLAPANVPDASNNLASRNLVRGSRYGLPSGQDVRAACITAGASITSELSPADILNAVNAVDPALGQRVRREEFHLKTPLWFYLLAEAQVKANGQTMGEIGSRIIAETFLAIIRSSRSSIFFPHPTDQTALAIFDPSNSPLKTKAGESLTTLPHIIHFVEATNPLG